MIMIKTALFLLLLIPGVASADCIITDTPFKFEVVCSGTNPVSPPGDTKTNRNTAKRSGKTAKVTVEGKEPSTPSVAMSERELQYMLARNQMDGYRAKLRTRVRVAGNQ